MLGRLFVRERRARLRRLRLDDVELLLHRLKRAGVALDAGVGGRNLRRGVLGVLNRAIASRGEVAVALVLLLRENLVRLIDSNGAFGRVDQRVLRFNRAHLAVDQGLRREHVRLGLVERHFVVAVVDAGEDLPGFDGLVVLNQNLDEVARDLRRDGDGVGLHIGVVGRDMEAADCPIVIAVPTGGGDRRETDAHHQEPADAGSGLCGGGGDRLARWAPGLPAERAAPAWLFRARLPRREPRAPLQTIQDAWSRWLPATRRLPAAIE